MEQNIKQSLYMYSDILFKKEVVKNIYWTNLKKLDVILGL